MKLVHINTQTYGGAGIVSRRLHQSLLELSFDSLLLTKFGIAGDISRHFYLESGKLRNFLRKQISRPYLRPITKLVQDLNADPNLSGRPKGYEKFSTLRSSVIDDGYDIVNECDIIHLHWISEFVEYSSFFKRFSNKKFVWTLHDMNPITGGCHHSDGCLRFQSACVQCPQLKNTIDENYSKVIQDAKIKALEHLRDEQMIVVSPSVWLAELSRKSMITGRFRHFVIPNPTFKSIVPFENKELIKKKLKIPGDKKILMFASENLNNIRKGISLLFEAVRSIAERKDIVLLGIGHPAGPQKGLDIVYTGSVSNVEVIANCYHVADIFVTPTLAENSPLVVIESLCCGTPVVASAVGGIPDLINHENGMLFPVGDLRSLQEAIVNALFNRKFDRDKVRMDALAIHAPEKIAERYLEVYRALKDF